VAATYFFSLNHVITNIGSGGSNISEARWFMMKEFLATMKLAGWVTRGSSISGSAGSLYSSAPDGVDRWTGRTVTEAWDGSNGIWQVLEHGTSHAQVVLTFQLAGMTMALAYAKNKFETGGAWRNVAAVSTRPTDTVSTPVWEREVPTWGAPNTFGVAAFPGTNYYHFMARDDGANAYAIVDTPTATTLELNIFGFSKLVTTNTADTNPVITWAARGIDHMIQYSDETTGPIYSRDFDGTLRFRQIARIKNRTSPYDLFEGLLPLADPFNGKGRLGPLAVWATGANPKYFRGTIPDVARAMQAWNHRDPVNSLNYMTFGCFAFPWDGSTSLGGTARTAEFLAMDVEGGGVGGGGGAPKAFWTGMENP
jgi:hypothetical protein